jgi:hypothetical protein
VSADANEMPMETLFNPHMDLNILPGDHASPLLVASARRLRMEG